MNLLRNPYSTKNGVVHWGSHTMPQADPATFRHLGGNWGRDDRHVFVQHSLKKIDITTFQYLNPVFVLDGNKVHDWNGVIKGADAKTFEVLDPGIVVSETITTEAWARGYGRDCNAVYFHDQMCGRATAVRGADPSTFVSLRNGYGYDSKSVWSHSMRLPNADPKTWLYLGRNWSLDRDRVFWAAREMPGFDRQSFTVVAAPTIGNLATDGVRFFHADLPVGEQEFWKQVSENFAAFELRFRGALHRLRNTCTTCHGSGDCYCIRKGGGDSSSCARCGGSGKCHVCKGQARIPV
ncbi:DKNYY domain-containing protein [Fimbriiglobus ruber]|uniref:DKNYY domain-containing protein n=1 Tax=Fimbriiglobus ruber TaxID=1908690 RepID=UPI000B4B08B1